MPVWTKADYDAYKARRLSSGAKPEQAVCHEPVATPQGETKDTGRIIVRITSFRRRLLDPDNLCPKYFVDGLRYAGLIYDDRPQDITLEVSQQQSKDERTEIELT